jgi:integrase
VAAMAELQWWVGLRPSEVVRMRVSDVDTAGDVWLYRLDAHKGSWRGDDYAGEVVPLGPECQRVLRPWIDAARHRGADAYLFQPSRKRKHACYTVASYNRAIARACAEAGVAHFSPYQIRHSAKKRIEEEVSTAAASAILRHRSLETTKRYARAQNVGLAQETARRVG